jgi:hypothetical protein
MLTIIQYYEKFFIPNRLVCMIQFYGYFYSLTINGLKKMYAFLQEPVHVRVIILITMCKIKDMLTRCYCTLSCGTS